ncbi:NUDIX hydrolase [Gordonia soli]|uniref:Nudix hydrolase domain-containing protein n=1 Tax=Gordonia soli NBRC 108243 TaxID=1223545 RepID=M0QDH0_9ACTN|nr:NUDIX domain-containing protein [Gordonia soli]GAC66658.1 hypothetical protein GS4_03_01060 [Gordonia soli NBRC 108243]
MPVPDFVVELRKHIGHAPLWMAGVTAVVRDERGHILLTHRADTHEWALVSGILEPGEEPAVAIRREIAEETGVEAEILRITGVEVSPPITYPNGDQAQYLDICFLAQHIHGNPTVTDDENTEVGWFALTDLPDGLAQSTRARLEIAQRDDPVTWFRR